MKDRVSGCLAGHLVKESEMQEFSVLTGGKAGAGIDRATLILGHLLNRCGYRIYVYHDYPSLIRGGHTFSIIRAAQTRIGEIGRAHV